MNKIVYTVTHRNRGTGMDHQCRDGTSLGAKTFYRKARRRCVKKAIPVPIFQNMRMRKKSI